MNSHIHGFGPNLESPDPQARISRSLETLIPQDRDAEQTQDYSTAIINTVRQPLLVLGPDLWVTTANRSFCDTFQVSSDEVKNREIFHLCGGSWDNSDLRGLLDQILKENSRFADFKFAQVFPRIGLRTLVLNAQRLVWEGEMSGPILLAIEDVTERESINTELKDSQERLRALTASLITAQEEERRRISRELHDDLDQKVAMLIVEMETLEKGPLRSAESMRKHLSSLRTQTEGISNDLRDTAHQLHPSVVDHLGLPAALQSLCADFSKQEKTEVHFRQRSVDIPIPPTIGLCLYRVTQEALRNVAKHSGARQATVCLLLTKSRILVSVRDFGAGFDLAFVGAKKGLGIVSMEERVRLVFGTLTIRSRPAVGTRVVVEVAVPKDKL
jgi:signal transduction histidine kinase